jgi:hypothetical protein
MSDSRIVTIRKSDTIVKEHILFPLLFLSPQFGYSVPSILRTIYNSTTLYIGNELDTFPHTIKEYFWIKEGVPGKDPWIALGILEDNTYFFYTAYMTTSTNTFVKNGHMNLWLSSQYSDLIVYAMDSSMYSLYLDSTEKTII